MTSNQIVVLIKNQEDCKLSFTKTKCSSPNDLYEIVFTQECDKVKSKNTYYLTEEELGYMARALAA